MENQIMVQIPHSVENLSLPDPELKTFYENMERRQLWIDDEISAYSLEYIRKILQWNAKDATIPIEQRTPIRLYFFSPGGDLDVNYSIIDVIRMSKTPIIGINMGKCCSAAAYIYLACHKRYMLPHSYFIFHQGSSNISGNFNEVYSTIVDYQQQVAELAEMMKQSTKYTEEYISDNITTEWYVRAEEAQTNGVCDQIVDDISIIM